MNPCFFPLFFLHSQVVKNLRRARELAVRAEHAELCSLVRMGLVARG